MNQEINHNEESAGLRKLLNDIEYPAEQESTEKTPYQHAKEALDMVRQDRDRWYRKSAEVMDECLALRKQIAALTTKYPHEVIMTNSIMKYFEYKHLPERLQVISRPFGKMAEHMNTTLPDCDEKTVGLRKLLEAKDCMVRAALDGQKEA